MKPLTTILARGAFAAAMGIGMMAATNTTASAYVACNRDGDCWHTDTRVHFPGVSLSFHNDHWWDRYKNDARYHWHDADAGHDWHHGYWDHGAWHGL